MDAVRRERGRFYWPELKTLMLRHFPTCSHPSRRSADWRRSPLRRRSLPPLRI